MRKSIPTLLGIVSILLLAGFGCDSSTLKELLPPAPPMEEKISSPDAQLRGSGPLVTFGQELTMSLHTKVSFRDGLVMELVSITDTRCPEGTKCANAGSATVKVQLSGGDVGAIPKELSVVLPGQVSAKQDSYFLFLGEGTTSTTAALTLSKQQSDSAKKPKPTSAAIPAKPAPTIPPNVPTVPPKVTPAVRTSPNPPAPIKPTPAVRPSSTRTAPKTLTPANLERMRSSFQHKPTKP